MKKRKNLLARKKRVRAKITGTGKRPRLSVSRSSKNIAVQLIDDKKGNTILSVSGKNLSENEKKGKTKTEIAFLVGEKIAKAAKSKKIQMVVFDRGGNLYHGRVKALAEGARKGGLIF